MQIVELDMAQHSGGWKPEIGQETQDLLHHFKDKLDQAGRDNLIETTSRILGQCVPASGPAASTTGLVIGYVQSGKTMSFTTVASMAVDNGYPVIIVITGTSNPLYDQSANRLERDLRLDSRLEQEMAALPGAKSFGRYSNCTNPERLE